MSRNAPPIHHSAHPIDSTLDTGRNAARAALDRAQSAIENRKVREGFARLIHDLDGLRQQLDPSAWKNFVNRTFREHPLHGLLRQDPFTRHAFDKPRGYPGDAELIDYIYGYGEGIVLPACTERGRQLYAGAMHTMPCRAVRARRTYLARVLDALADRRSDARAVSIAAGHLREASIATACTERRLAELVALDQDERSLATIAADYSALDVRPLRGRVRALLTGRQSLHDFDLAYSTGLFDYLGQRTARALTEKMFAMLRPGGELVIANFDVGVSGIGYMEACMDWHLVYRDAAQMLDLCADIAPRQIVDRRVERDSTGGILFLHVRRG